MNSKKIKLFILVGVVILASAAGLWYGRNKKSSALLSPRSAPNTVFALTELPQDAVFDIAIGWTGGMGSAPVLDASGARPQEFNSEPIFFDESKVDEVRARGKMPSCFVGRPTITVSANITLTPRTGINRSIPPDRTGYQPTQNYYEAVVNTLYKAVITAEPCKE